MRKMLGAGRKRPRGGESRPGPSALQSGRPGRGCKRDVRRFRRLGHMEPQQPTPRRRRWALRLAIVLGLLAIAAVVAIGSLPLWLNSAGGRRWLLTRADRAL